MIPIASILVATDFSPDGDNAAWRAALLARQLDARLRLLHVVDSTRFMPWRAWLARPIDIDLEAARARASLRQLCSEIASRHDVTTAVEVRVGDPHEELVRASAQADLLVLGQRGRNPLKTLVLGGTAVHMLRISRAPVLVVKRSADAPYRQVLVPVDLTARSDGAVQIAAALAPRANVHVFHAIASAREAVLREAEVTHAVLLESRARDEARVNARMRRSVARLGLDGRRVRFSLAHGAPLHSTLQQLRASDTDLVVVGQRDESAGIRFLSGSVSSRLLAKTDCDTVIVPHTICARLPAQTSPFARAGIHAQLTST